MQKNFSEPLALDKIQFLKAKMRSLSVKSIDIAEEMGVDLANITLFLGGKKRFTDKTKQKYLDAFEKVFNQREARRNEVAEKMAIPVVLPTPTEAPAIKPQKPSLRIKEILPLINEVREELDRYCIYQVAVARKTGIDGARISRFLRGKAYTKQARNLKVIEACKELINEKKKLRGELLSSS